MVGAGSVLGREGQTVEDPFSSLLLEGLSLKEKAGSSLSPTASRQWKAAVNRPVVVLHKHKCGGGVQGVCGYQCAVGLIHGQL